MWTLGSVGDVVYGVPAIHLGDLSKPLLLWIFQKYLSFSLSLSLNCVLRVKEEKMHKTKKVI